MNDVATRKSVEPVDTELAPTGLTELTDAQIDQVAGGAAFHFGPFVFTPSGNFNVRGRGNVFRF
jgi:hypothetical protein